MFPLFKYIAGWILVCFVQSFNSESTFLYTMSRYIRQEVLDFVGKNGQKKLSKAIVAVVGLGALGSHVVDLLSRAGIGKLILIDRDFVELQNLQRQCVYIEDDVGKPKVHCAVDYVGRVNSSVTVAAHFVDLDFKNISLLKKVDLVVDCTDNLSTRFLLNEFCLQEKIPWVHGGVVHAQGTVLFFDGSFCFKCLFSEASGLGTCDTLGVLNSAVSVVASLQVTEVLKYFLGLDVCKKMLRYDALICSLDQFEVKRKIDCSCCVSKKYSYLLGDQGETAVKLCGKDMYQIKLHNLDLKTVKSRLRKSGNVVDAGYMLKFKQLTIFEDGRVLVSARDEKQAKTVVDKYLG